jgi:hypothetical protein
MLKVLQRDDPWRDEVETANKRCLGKVPDQTSVVAQSVVWPDQVLERNATAPGETSKTQLEMIDRMVEGWKHQLKSATAPMAIPRCFTDQRRVHSASMLPVPVAEFNPFAPWTSWFWAAELWQRTSIPEVLSPGDIRSPSHSVGSLSSRA